MPTGKSKHSNRYELLGSLEENHDDEDIVQNPNVQTYGSLANKKIYGGNNKKCKMVTEVKTQTCEYNKAEVKWASRNGLSECVRPQQIQDTDLNSLFDADLELHHIAQGSRWLRLETVMDSVASESVAPPSVAPQVKIEESDGSRWSQTYPRPSGDRLPNLGENKQEVTASDGQAATATYQVADVTRRATLSLVRPKACSLRTQMAFVLASDGRTTCT